MTIGYDIFRVIGALRVMRTRENDTDVTAFWSVCETTVTVPRETAFPVVYVI